MIGALIFLAVGCLLLWGVVRLVNRHHKRTWGDAHGQEPRDGPPSEATVARSQDTGP